MLQRPIQLISFDSNKNAVLSIQAINLIKKMETKKLHVITVAGKYRTGKSYILNRVILENNQGFQVGPTINACTKGLWIWPELLHIQDQQNQVKDCLVIDTEGLGSLQQGENTDLKIFLLALLLSSYLIYNSVGSIDQKALQSLNLVVSLAEILQKEDNVYDSQELINMFPSFLWLVRDFSLKLVDEKGQNITAEEYLQNALRQNHKLKNTSVLKKNQIRKQLKKFFQNRDCFTLIRPTENQKDLQNLSTLPERKLRPQFLKLIKRLKQRICINIPSKRIRGKTITNQGFVELCEYFVKTINSGKLPSINSHWEYLCMKESSLTIEKYGAYFQEQVSGQTNLSEVKKISDRLLEEGLQKLEKSFLGKLQKQLSKEKLFQILKNALQNHKSQIQMNNRAQNNKIIAQIFRIALDKPPEDQVRQLYKQFQDYKDKTSQDFRIYTEFYEESKIFFAHLFNNYTVQTKLEDEDKNNKIILFKKNIQLSLNKNKKIQQQLNQSIRTLKIVQHQLKIAKNYSKQLQKQYEKKLEKINEEKMELQNKILQLQQKNKQQMIVIQQIYKKQKQRQREILEKEIHMLQINLSKMSSINQNSSIKQRKTNRQTQIVKDKCAEYLQDNIDLRQKLDCLSGKIEQYQHQINRNSSFNHLQVPDIVKKLTQKIEQLQYNLNLTQNQNQKLQQLVHDHHDTTQTLIKVPSHINYQALKKNYEIQQQNHFKTRQKIQEMTKIFNFCSRFQCSGCKQLVDSHFIKTHYTNCMSYMLINLDVSYQFGGQGQLIFVIDVCMDDKRWSVMKNVNNIKQLFNKTSIMMNNFDQQNEIFDENDPNQNQERRIYLQEVCQSLVSKIWQNSYLIEFFAIDLHFKKINSLNHQNKQKDLSISSQNYEIKPQLIESNNLMKTTKFTKKIFNFGPHIY